MTENVKTRPAVTERREGRWEGDRGVGYERPPDVPSPGNLQRSFRRAVRGLEWGGDGGGAAVWETCCGQTDKLGGSTYLVRWHGA